MDAPPAFLRLAGHPLRWRLLRELAHSDLRVGELCGLAGEQQSLVSYHLRQLRDGGLVRARRSSADGRDSYYSLDLARCRDGLADVGAALHPALASHTRPRTARARVLFVCTGNSARSPMAAALCEQRSHGSVSATSAGSHPKPLQAGAVRVLRTRGIDLAGRRPRHLDELAGERFDHVISLCDRVRERCPEARIHWSIPEPHEDAAFEAVAAELETRIGFLIDAVNAGGIHA
ncbi:arsenate reductase/protein-tyrosine-phosphatase family protein [Solirubrobacter deserti]|uniref:ArsR family transcriptional regulator n=1 Tax=Solirubrobacter deserti TaxID=2282478 RepID=A0ABT4RQI6_9ACTN|nr:ArsR family transcriptional regulator [Solirubrobacter deserti]MDA0140791.1 ArsR family transcriptional regulator [Solirubrobacter deserti]